MPFSSAMQTKYLAVAILSATLLVGCGGGSGSGVTPSPSPVVSPTPTPTTSATFSLHWGARSRATNAPVSALSVRVVLPGARANGSDASITVNRTDSPAEYVETVTLPEPVLVGARQVVVTCNALRDATGPVVAVGQADITIAADGSGIGDIALTNTIRSVTVAANQSVLVGTRADLDVACRDSLGALVPVTPGSIFLSVVEGGERLRIAGGQAEAMSPGTATVQATVDGITSSPATVQVTSQAVVTIMPPTLTITTGKTQKFTAAVSNTDNQAVTWSIQEGTTGGTIAPDGTYQAPSTPGTYHIVATSQYDPVKQATATVTVVPPVPQVIYTNNFEGTVGAEWSRQETAVTPVGARRFLGIFGQEAAKLSLSALPAHASLTVTCKLYLIRTWDGNMISPVVGQGYGPDIWSLLVDEQSLLRASFSNWDPGTFPINAPQSFPGNFGVTEFPGRQGASEKNTLGYPSAAPYPFAYQDSVYTLTYTIPHSASTATINFSGLETLNGGVPGDEGWGIDDVQVSITE